MIKSYGPRIGKILSVALFVTTLSACPGIKFNNSVNVFRAPPASLSERTLWNDPSIIQYKLESLSGYMIVKSKNETKFRRVRQILPDDNFTLEPESIPDGEFYHSLVNAKFAAEGSGKIPLFASAASLQSDQMMEITILDKALIHIDDRLIPWDKLSDFVKKNPLGEGDERYWVQAAMLTQMLSKIATSVKSDAQVSGSAYQVNGKVFNAAETVDRSPYITMLLLDVDKAISGTGRVIFDAKAAINRGRVTKNIQLPLE